VRRLHRVFLIASALTFALSTTAAEAATFVPTTDWHVPIVGTKSSGYSGSTIGCWSSGNCIGMTIYGSFNSKTGNSVINPYLYVETNGSWSAPTLVPLPSGATDGDVLSINCLSGGTCIVDAVSFDDNFNVTPWIFSVSGGTVSAPITVATPPSATSYYLSKFELCDQQRLRRRRQFQHRLDLLFFDLARRRDGWSVVDCASDTAERRGHRRGQRSIQRRGVPVRGQLRRDWCLPLHQRVPSLQPERIERNVGHRDPAAAPERL
jgi:hypothetical protein